MSQTTQNTGSMGAGMPPKSSSSKNNNMMAIVLGILLLGSLVFNGIFFSKNVRLKEDISKCENNVDQVVDEKTQVLAELNSMVTQYDALSSENQTMSAELQSERDKIKKLIEQAKNKDWTIGKLKKETETLREIMKGYLHTIDSLNTANQFLTEENTTVKTELTGQKEVNSNLEKEKSSLSEKVKIGSLLHASNIRGTGIINKNSGASKDTEKASRADAIKVTFTLAENKIAPAGNKRVYLRIISPFGAILGEQQDDGFLVSGNKSIFTQMKDIDYRNQAIETSMVWQVSNPITKGDYTIQLYADGVELGSGKFSLK